MEVTTEKEDNFLIIKPDGDVDAGSSIILDEALANAVENKETKIIVDCSRLNYISSAGLGVFMSYLEDFKENNIYLAIYNVSEKIRNVFSIVGLDELINIEDSKEEAQEKGK